MQWRGLDTIKHRKWTFQKNNGSRVTMVRHAVTNTRHPQQQRDGHRIITTHGKTIGVRPGTPTDQCTTSVLTGLREFTLLWLHAIGVAAVFKGELVKLTVLKGISAYSMADRQPEIVVNSPFRNIVNKLFFFMQAVWKSLAILAKYMHGMVQIQN